MLGSSVKFKNLSKNDILNAVKGLNEKDLVLYNIKLNEIQIDFENDNLKKTEKDEVTDGDLGECTHMTEIQRKINKLKWLLFCHLGADKKSFHDLYDSMLVNENVSEENKFEILSLFPYLRLYRDLSENERKLFSNGCLPKTFFEKDFLTQMMKCNIFEDNDLKGQIGIARCKQKFRKMFIDICQSRIDEMKKSGAYEILEFLCKLASSVYHSGNPLPHFLTKSDHSFTTIRSFFDKGSNKSYFSPCKFADEFINLKLKKS